MEINELNDLDVTVGKGCDFDTFKQVIDYIFETYSYKKALEILGLDDVQELAEALTDKKGMFEEDLASDLCMEQLDGIDAEDDDPKAEWDDEMYDRAAGKQALNYGVRSKQIT